MNWVRFFQRKQCDDQLADDLDAYLESAVEENMARGMTAEQARTAARRKLGNPTLIREEVYRMNSVAFLETIWQDVRYSLRNLAKNPAFTLVVVLSLALGIGANTAIFSLIDAALLKMLPVSHPEQLVNFTTSNRDFGANYAFAYPAFQRFRENRRVFAGVFAFYDLDKMNLEVNGQGGIAMGQAVSGNYFPTLGVHPALGRMILPADGQAREQGAVAVIGYDYWRTRFAMDRAIVGRQIVLNNAPFTIIGVTAPGFYGLQPGARLDVSVPLNMVGQVRPGWAAAGSPYDVLRSPFRNWLHIMARLRPGITVEKALAATQPVQAQTVREAVESMGGLPFNSPAARRSWLETKLVLSAGGQGLSDLRQQFSKPLYIVMSIVGLLLLVSCANVANLLLSRANSREKEIAVRFAIGAGRRRLVRQLITESALLAVCGGGLGLLLAFAGSGSLLALMARSNSPVTLTIHPDGAILGFTLGVSLLTVLLSGLIPALRATRINLSASQVQATRNSGKTTARSGLGKSLVVLQVAVSIVLLIGASLLARSLGNLENLRPGFSKDHVLLFSINPESIGHKGPERADMYQRMLGKLEAVPGVRSASLSIYSPLSGGNSDTNPVVEGYTPPPGKELAPVDIEVVAPGFFKTLGISVLSGRDFTSADRNDTPKVTIVNQTMAHYYFGDSNPIGRRFSIPGWLGDPRPMRIIAVVGDARYHDLREQAAPMAYVPFLQSDEPRVTFALRTSVRPEALMNAVRRAVAEVDSRLPLFDVQTLSEQVDKSLVEQRLVASLSTVFGVLAVILACVGLYGLMAYAVTRRTNEIGIRMALGAQRSQVAGMVLRETLTLVVMGLAIGIPASLAVSRLISSELYGLKPNDPLTILMAGIAMAGVAALAGYLPARRASRVDPMTALRYE